MDDNEPTARKRHLRALPKPEGDLRYGAVAGKRAGGVRAKLMHKVALEAENEKLQHALLDRDEQLERLSQQYNSLGAVCHALVLRHGRQIFSLHDLEEQCTLAALRWGREGEDRVVLELAVQGEPPEGKVS